MDNLLMKDVCITGMGIISALGNDFAESYQSLSREKSGINPIRHLSTRHASEFMVGEVNLSNSDLLDLLRITSYKDYTRTSLLAIKAAVEAYESADLSACHANKRIGIVSATTVGGMDKTEIEYAHSNYESGFLFTHASGDSTNKIANYLNITGYRTTISTACSSAANALMHAARLIKHNKLDIVIAGGTDALSKFTLNGFNSLMILDKEFCKPFDEHRNGLNLGEGAAYLVLESVESAINRNAEIHCRLAGYANANDAFHQTASSPNGEGAYRAMKQAIEMGNLNVSDIDYINVHGTGTLNNDLSEGIALGRIFSSNMPPFSSTKSYTGHTLGAAAAIEAVISISTIKNEQIYPNLNFTTPIQELAIKPVTKVTPLAGVQHVLSNSFGFGGNNSSLIFSSVNF